MHIDSLCTGSPLPARSPPPCNVLHRVQKAQSIYAEDPSALRRLTLSPQAPRTAPQDISRVR